MRWKAKHWTAGAIGVCLLMTCCIVRAVAAEPKPILRFNADGKFKIVQFTDAHWNEDTAKCRKTLELINSVLDQEKPDLVVMTGDIITLPRTPQAGWNSVTKPMIGRKIPWAVVLGNHDDERHGVSRRDIVKHLAALPFSVVEEGPESLGGTGNYILEIVGKNAKPAAALYMLDSHAYPRLVQVRNCKAASQYDWLSFDQIQWYRQSSHGIRTANPNEAIPALAFFHIPLVEYTSPILLKNLIGSHKEKDNVCCGALNSGMFTAFVEEGDVMGVFVGHDHDNDFAGSLFGVCLGYGRCSGFGAYGILPRGGRVIELTEGKREFESWIREVGGAIALRFHYPTAFEQKKAKKP
jgi:hypothetical protein